MYVKAQARIFLALLGKGAILFNKVRLTFRLKFRSRGKRRKRSVSMHVAIHNFYAVNCVAMGAKAKENLIASAWSNNYNFYEREKGTSFFCLKTKY